MPAPSSGARAAAGRLFGDAQLSPGAVLTFQVTAPGRIGRHADILAELELRGGGDFPERPCPDGLAARPGPRDQRSEALDLDLGRGERTPSGSLTIHTMVTGEGVGFESAAAQPGGRPPAPGDLALVQAFVNSHYDLEVEHGADLFSTPSGLARWLSDRGLLTTSARLRARELSRAVTVREGLRRLAAGNNGAGAPASTARLQGLNHAAAGAAVEIRLDPAGPRFVATGAGLDRALGQVLAITATAMLDGTWRRLKVCPGDHCGWAFYDHSRNQTGRWCSMSVCGGRAKARAHYHRHREGDHW